jgi:hydroxymethylbilane synthase
MAERAFLEALGGNCHSAVAAYAVLEGDMLHLDTALYSEDGADCVQRSLEITLGDAQSNAATIPALASDMLSAAPESISRLFEPI